MRRRFPLLLGLCGSLALAVGACSSAYSRTEGAYCTAVRTNAALLNPATITTSGEVAKVVAAWRRVAATAPLQVQSEWDTVIASLALASSVNPTDAASVQNMAEAARRSTQAANRVIAYTSVKCGVLIGTVKPVATPIPPQVFPPTTT